MRKTKLGFDRSSQTFADASEIMGAPAQPKGIHSIDVQMADNGGATVHHTPKAIPGKGKDNTMDGGDYGKRQTNVFSTAHEAHAHIGNLMGIKAHAPKAGAGGGGLT